jgi:hypothetical protein
MPIHRSLIGGYAKASPFSIGTAMFDLADQEKRGRLRKAIRASRDALETHRTLTAALRTAANLSAVSTFFPPSLVFSGRHLTTWSESREDERLVTTAELVVGVREI